MFYLISFALHVQAEATFYAEASYAAAFVIFWCNNHLSIIE